MSGFDALGTPESTWLPLLPGLPALALDDPPARAVVVAPHPDDEVLAVGGLLRLLARAGSVVEVVAVTDGEASNPGGTLAPDDLAVVRRAETAAALGRLGLQPPVVHLHLRDGGAAALEQPVLDEVHLRPGDWLLAPWELDGHPDHEAVGRACSRAAERDGARLLAFPVWAWHWGTPTDLPLDRAVRVDLTEDARGEKSLAVAEFVTQTTAVGPLAEDAPVLPPHVLARFTRPYEVVFA